MNNKIAEKLIQHDKSLEAIQENMVTKKEHQDVMSSLDKIIKVVERLEQERVFTTQWVQRVEKNIEVQEQEITKIKQHLNIA